MAKEHEVVGNVGQNKDLDAVLVFNLLKTQNYLAPFMDAGLRQERLTATQFNALLVLKTAGTKGLLMGEIGVHLVVTKSNVTGLVDRLEKRGWVQRGAHHDRRAVVVRLTSAGKSVLKRTVPCYSELLAQVTGCLTDKEKQKLAALLSKLREELRQCRKKLEIRSPKSETNPKSK